MSPRIACWRIQANPARRLARGPWHDGAPTPEQVAEYQRLGWVIEYAYMPMDAAA